MKQDLLEKLHQYEVEILYEIKRICELHGLTYYLMAGTLLGAVRHKGFIPWDDDIDVGMPREDFEKFEQIVKNELKDKFYFQSMETDDTWKRYYAKVRMNDTLFVERKDVQMSWNHGIFVDIFPFDKGIRHHGIYGRVRSRMVTIINAHIFILNHELPYNMFHRILKRLIPDRFFYSLRKNWSKQDGDCYINYGGMYGIQKETIEIDKCNPPRKLTFEGKEYLVPNDYDFYLRSVYGDDYMQLPPPEKRITHDPVRLSFDTSGPDETL